MRELEEDLRRIDRVNIGTPTHWWSSYDSEKSNPISEINPSKLNLNKAEDFLLFVDALNHGELKSLAFLQKIPKKRKDELKQIHAQFSGFLPALDQ